MTATAPSELFSSLDSDRFGCRIARASISTTGEVEATIQACKDQQIEMLIARCPIQSLPALHAMLQGGALIMDTLIYYQCNLRRAQQPKELRRNLVRSSQPADLESLASLVRASFHEYQGHYHADPRLDRAKATEGYVDWALRMCQVADRSLRQVMVGESPLGRVTGFATMRMNSPEEGEGVLFGVHPDAEGKGLYWSLMVHAVEWCKAQGANRMVLSTQLTNTVVQKVWVRFGFEPCRAFYTLHLWLTPRD